MTPISPWRLALTAGAVVVLGVAGIGIVAATSQPAIRATGSSASAPLGAPAGASAGEPAGAPATADDALALADDLLAVDAGALRPNAAGLLPGRHPLVRVRHLVHATVTVTAAGGTLVTFQFDHGTIAAIDGGTITISEAGGGSVTVRTDADTRVRDGRSPTTIGALKVGLEIVVRSRGAGPDALAKAIVILPAAPTSSGG